MRRLTLLMTVLAFVLVLGVPVFAQGDQPAQIHVVQPGENLFRISLRYGTTIAELQSANGIANPNLIFVGQQLLIPGAGPVPTQEPPAEPTEPPASGGTYVVVSGDTLSKIARQFGTTYTAIASANGITNPNLIYVGQVLTIPGSSGDGGTPPVDDGGSSQPPPTTSGFELGGHVSSFSYPAQMRGAGMTWVKRQLVWNRGQGPEIAQPLIDQARSNGFKILLGITGQPGELGADRSGYIAEFANFLGGVAALGPEGIEVWNEPNIDHQWPAGQISGAAYTEMLRAGYNAIKAANSSVLVISAAPSPTGAEGAFPGRVVNDDNFIRDMAANGAASYMDCVGLHYNEGIVPPTARSGDPRDNSGHYSRYYPTMVSLYSGVFPGKSLCFTELGYLSSEGYGPLPAGFSWAVDVSVQDQATWLNQAVIQARSSGIIRLMIIWNVDFTTYGDDPQAGYAIVRPNGECPSCVTLRAAMGL